MFKLYIIVCDTVFCKLHSSQIPVGLACARYH